MPLRLYPAVPADAGRISEIHMAAFADNAMLLAQFPTPEVRAGLKESIRMKALADISDARVSVLVVRELLSDPGSSNTTGAEGDGNQCPGVVGEGEMEESAPQRIIAFAKWSHPVSEHEDYEEPAWVWPAGTNMKILNSWVKAAEESQDEVVGDRPCYRLTFMGTDPAYERRGAASMMVNWGLEQCNKGGVPGYLESTLEAAPFYEKMGFAASGKISMRYLIEGQEQSAIYEEIAFVYRPGSS
ncbi:putative GNAT family acetyltransferase [Xylaria bambusicola]|uniref:putative GNAT family acetyltransferase n=1 Tax=Xylaria bambusicola TaxID=326684 RepID=UPI002008AEAF|nr:putative GNAT family acetyltransferase [Xylaria bambusicola]KAI0521227.1 putative GNAT family acetyltransferase [Xylaria bambusicola]